MLRDAWFIGRKDARNLLRGREALLWVFVMPIVFFYFIGTVTSGFGGGRGDTKDPIAMQTPEDAGFLAKEIVRRLEENGFRVVRPATAEELAASSRRLVLSDGFTGSVLDGSRGSVEFSRSESGLGQQYDVMRVGRAVYTVLADVVAAAAAGDEPSPEALARLREMPRALTLEVRSAGKRKTIPTGFEQAVPGILVMFTLLVLLTGGTTTLVIERRQGLLRRLASTPISRGEIVLGKWGGRLVLGFVQIAFAMLAGTFLFRMSWGPQLWMVLLVLLGWAALCASLALLLGSVVRTEGQAVGIGVLASNVLAALGGCWWPIEITPGWMQGFAKALPTGWAMDAMHRLISFRAGAASVVPHLLALFAAALVVGWLGVRRFRYE